MTAGVRDLEITVNINVDPVLHDLSRLSQIASSVLPWAIYDEALEVMKDSKDNYVPVDTGALKISGMVDNPIVQPGGRSVVDMHYDTPYALVQHEDRTLRHQRGKSAKYLERPLMRRRQTILANVENKVMSALTR